MESLFPQLFTFIFFVPTVLRIAAAIAYADLAAHLYKHRAEVATTKFPFIGVGGPFVAVIAYASSMIIALLFATGFLTQAAAIIGLLGAIKCLIFEKRYPGIIPHGRLAYFLLAVVCLAILVSGAGAFAFDKPY
jgi:hypothetical protein